MKITTYRLAKMDEKLYYMQKKIDALVFKILVSSELTSVVSLPERSRDNRANTWPKYTPLSS